MNLTTHTPRRARARCTAVGLIECTAYIALFSVVLALTFMSFYRAHANSSNLHRDAADISRALQAGERWRADVRTATAPPRWVQEAAHEVLRLPRNGGDVSYAFRDGGVWRQALPNTNWMPVLPATAHSSMQAEARQQVTTWRWDVELKSRPRAHRTRPVFSFVAVAPGGPKP